MLVTARAHRMVLSNIQYIVILNIVIINATEELHFPLWGLFKKHFFMSNNSICADTDLMSSFSLINN